MKRKTDYKPPFVYFGGKSAVAEVVWYGPMGRRCRSDSIWVCPVNSTDHCAVNRGVFVAQVGDSLAVVRSIC